MKILIIGGTGNISTGITQGLQNQDHHITLFKKTPQRPVWLNSNIKIISGEREDLSAYKGEVFKNGNYDCVIDMICFEPSDAQKDIDLFAGKTKQFIFCSTVDVYKKTPDHYPVTEENGIIGASPSFAYGYKKVECEKLLWNAHKKGDFKLTIIRPAFTYNESWSPGIHSFGGQTYHLDRLKRGKAFLMHGDGTSIWVATHRDDTATAFLGAIGNKKTFGEAYNVTGDELMTHNHIWKIIAKILEAPLPDFVYIPTDLLATIAPLQAEWCRENFRYNNIYDNSKAKADLGFKYTITFEEGSRRCINYLKKNNLIENSDNYPFYDRIIEEWKKAVDTLNKSFKEVPL